MEIKTDATKIYEYMKKHNLTKKEFCKLCEISVGVLRKIEKGQTNFSSLAMIKIAKVTGLKISDIVFCC